METSLSSVLISTGTCPDEHVTASLGSALNIIMNIFLRASISKLSRSLLSVTSQPTIDIFCEGTHSRGHFHRVCIPVLQQPAAQTSKWLPDVLKQQHRMMRSRRRRWDSWGQRLTSCSSIQMRRECITSIVLREDDLLQKERKLNCLTVNLKKEPKIFTCFDLLDFLQWSTN